MKTTTTNMISDGMLQNHTPFNYKGLNKYLLMLFMVPVFSGCNYMDKMANLTSDNLKLHKEIDDKKAAVDYFTKSYADIENNLITIKAKQNIIGENISSEVAIKKDVKERIKDDLKQIDALMTENKRMIADLDVRLARSSSKNEDMQKMVKNLYAQIDEKQKEYNALKQELVAARIDIQDYRDKIETMGYINESQSNIIGYQTAKINTAYYVTGTYKELKDDGILTKKGGIIGIGSTKTLKGDFDKTYFNKVEIDKLKEIPLQADKVSIITNHPSDSYTIEKVDGEVDKLVITNPEKFWETSKYLVVMAK